MDSAGKRSLTLREKRHSASRRSPYSRPVKDSNAQTDLFDDLNDEEPSLRLRLARFLNPWHKEMKHGSQSLGTSPQDDIETPEVQVVEDVRAEVMEDQETMAMEAQQETATEITVVKDTVQLDLVEYLDGAGQSGTFNSESTLVASLQEPSTTSEDSVVDASEELHGTKRHLDLEESVLSGQDSDTVTDRKDLKRSKKKPQSRSSTPVRSTRRTTRSLAAKTEEEGGLEENTNPELEQKSEVVDEKGSTTEIPTAQANQPAETSTNTKGGKKKKKKKGKHAKQSGAEETEEVERETVDLGDRIADQLRKSNEIIKESKALGGKLEALEEATEEVLEETKDPFSQVADEDEVATAEDDEDQTFHSTKQFEANEDSDDMERLYPVVEEEPTYYEPDDDGEEESADTVKYYPPESPAAIDEDEDQAIVNYEKSEEQEVQGSNSPETIADAEYSGDTRKSPSPEPVESGLEVPENVEFSPMQSRSSSPTVRASTPPNTERFVDCPPIVTPKTTRIRDFLAAERFEAEPVSPTDKDFHDNWDMFGMHPVHNIAFLEAFFKRQKGRLLTPKQANYCCQLIMDSVIPSTNATWVPGEDGVSFKKAGNSRSEQTPAARTPHKRNGQMTPVASSSESHKSSIPIRSILRAAPFAVLRQPAGAKDQVPKQAPLSSLDEYLEIEKYRGVEWDDLPNHVKVKRFLEWKGTEPPEVAKKRRMERREQVRKENAEFWAQREKAEKAEKAQVLAAEKAAAAAQAAMEAEKAEETAAAAKAALNAASKEPAPKRKVSISESLLDDDDEHIPNKKKTSAKPSTSMDTSPPASPVTTATETGASDRPQTVLATILAIVNKDSDSKKDDKKEQKESETTPLASSGSTATAALFTTPTSETTTKFDAVEPIFTKRALKEMEATEAGTSTPAPAFSFSVPPKTDISGTSSFSSTSPSKPNNSAPFTFSFGAPPKSPFASSSNSLFSNPTVLSPGVSKPLFGAQPAARSEKEDAPKPLFGAHSVISSGSNSASKSLFGATPASSSSAAAIAANTASIVQPSFSFGVSKSDALATSAITSTAKPVAPMFNFEAPPCSVAKPPPSPSGSGGSSFSSFSTMSKDTPAAIAAFGTPLGNSISFGKPLNQKSPEDIESTNAPKTLSSPFGAGPAFGSSTKFVSESSPSTGQNNDVQKSTAAFSPWSIPAGNSFKFGTESPGSSSNKFDSTSDSTKLSVSGAGSHIFSSGSMAFGTATAGLGLGSGFGGSSSSSTFATTKKDGPSQPASVNPFAAFTKPSVLSVEASPQSSDSGMNEQHSKDDGGSEDDEIILLSGNDEETSDRGDDDDAYGDEDGDDYDDAEYDEVYEDDQEYGDDNEGQEQDSKSIIQPQSFSQSQGDRDSDEEEDDEDKENRPLPRSTIQPSSTPLFGQSSLSSSVTSAFGARRPSGTDIFNRRESSSSTTQQQAPKTPEFDYHFGPVRRLSAIERPSSPTLKDSSASLFSPASASWSSASNSSSQPGFSFGSASTSSSSNISGLQKASRMYDYDDDDEEEVQLIEDLEQDADGTVSPFASPVLSPQSTP
ncbi:hypothetical protein EDD11_005224 [Mortierella claussenii]|nr:hypothetical protein EDD11_005224 [Mortierella claussenii]